jgi:type I restriction enzyme S subunit
MSFEEWKEVEIQEIITFNPKESLKKGTKAKKVTMQNLEPFTRKIQSYANEKVTGGSKFRNGDTLLARITPCLENGKTAYVDILDDDEVAFGSTEFIVMRAKENISDEKFIYYLSISPLFREIAIQSMTGSSGRQRVQVDVLEKSKMKLPAIEEQKEIAKILSSIDDKIELNNQINKNLEAMAQAIFKSWFVDFEPFQDGEFVESELGMIPKEWMVGNILDFADLLSGATPKTSIPEYWNGDILWVTAKDVAAKQGCFILDTERKITHLGVEKSNAKILPKNTIVITARGTVGAYALLGCEMTINQSTYGLKSKDNNADYYLYFTIARFIELLRQHSYGTVFNTITTKTFKSIKIIIPERNVLNRFNQVVSPFMEKVVNNQLENRTLATLRDTLLPKLMSGEVRVPPDFEGSDPSDERLLRI